MRSASRPEVAMKYALISDIHGNLPALETVLASVDARADVDATYHLGGLVGYAPWPNEVAALLRERGVPGIAGNYDSTAATRAARRSPSCTALPPSTPSTGPRTGPTPSAPRWRRLLGPRRET